ncbi:uncharacterized protein LOC103109733 [Erinaceus europaeus]|uniref:Cytochrome c oxidase subunit 7C, mitochondrial n=2 Tax=Erinaceus europaeus TaxID=9365 RepID=A0A1S2ZG85_ERIEU|nr:uncharacterized protein LOC103109733 [Erinaceus europaeus]XP_060057123.1 uncharacterized protein LOC103109733 [Erinaceus europaeus]
MLSGRQGAQKFLTTIPTIPRARHLDAVFRARGGTAPFPIFPFGSCAPSRNKVVETRVSVGPPPFVFLWVSALFRRASDSAMLGQSIRRFTTSVVRRSHYEEGPGKNLPFSVENKWRLLVMMTLYLGSGFAAPFFIVRHQLLKK